MQAPASLQCPLGQNCVVQPLLTDMYQITMAYAYWKSGKTEDCAVFELFFRKNPFSGEFTIFAGLEECVKFLHNFRFSTSDIQYLRDNLPSCIENEFFAYLSQVTARDITLHAVEEGSVVFPRIPMIRIEGPLIVAQLIETTLLNLVNYASLLTTNAARYRLAAGNLQLYEFGLRRAQGPDGGLSASKYAYIGGFDGTSNVLAGKLFNIPIKGTHAHSYVTSFTDFSDLHYRHLVKKGTNESVDLLELTCKWLKEVVPQFKGASCATNKGELAAFISYAIAFPDIFSALVDTYDVEKCGLINFCAVALALNDLGYQAKGIRIDSGDLAYLSQRARDHFIHISEKYGILWFRDISIMASNDINEETIMSLNEQGHKINCFGIGKQLFHKIEKQTLLLINGMPRL